VIAIVVVETENLRQLIAATEPRGPQQLYWVIVWCSRSEQCNW
jgi:hypothetical protein